MISLRIGALTSEATDKTQPHPNGPSKKSHTEAQRHVAYAALNRERKLRTSAGNIATDETRIDTDEFNPCFSGANPWLILSWFNVKMAF